MQLKPSSNWHVDYADDSCRLARKFGDGERVATLIMDQLGPGQYFKLTLSGSAFKQVSNEWVIKLKFGPGEDVQDMSYFLGSVGKAPALIMQVSMRLAPPSKAEQQAMKRSKDERFEIAPIGADRIAAVSELNIDGPLRQPVRLLLGSMKAPMAAMDKCIGELLNHWGVDAAKFASQSRPARGDEKSKPWIVDEDYPVGMILDGKRAIVSVRLNVDATGAPTACHIQQSTGPKLFDDTVCRALMRRARFEPALDADGKPFASVVRQGVTFR